MRSARATSTRCSRTACRSTSACSRCFRSTCCSGASRSTRSRSRISTSRRTCSGRSPRKPKRSATSARGSSRPRARTRRRKAGRGGAYDHRRARRARTAAPADAGRDRRRAQFDDHRHVPDRVARSGPEAGRPEEVSILKTVTPVTHDLGSFEVRRAVPSPECRMVGPFVFVDQFGPAQLAPGEGMDVRPHPHINLATVTWLFEGAIDHRDSLGTFSTDQPGTVNLMTAGSGIVHSERSPASERAGGPKLYGMQTWLALPDGREEIDAGVRGGQPTCRSSTTAARTRGSSWARCGASARRRRPMPRRSTPRSCSSPAARSRSRPRPTSARSCWSAATRPSTASRSSCTTSTCSAPARR